MSYNTSGYLLWLADVVRAGGMPVIETDGWKTRGHDNFIEARGVMCHHTGNAQPGNYPSQEIIMYGRQDLAGPLSQLGLGRDGTVYIIAAGVAWHAGTGSWPWLPKDMGNWYSIGIEAESAGTYDDWTPAQRAAYPKLCAILSKALGVDGSRVVAHKEYSDAGKIDPAYWDMNGLRATVNNLLTTTPGEPDMDMNTPVDFASNVKAYFDSTGGAGFGDLMVSNFPQGGSVSYGIVTSWDAMSARAAYFKAANVEKQLATVESQLAAVSAKLDQLLAKK